MEEERKAKMNSETLRPAKFESSAINGAFREKDDSGGSFYCYECEEEENTKDKKKTIINTKKASEKQYNAARSLKSLISGQARI